MEWLRRAIPCYAVSETSCNKDLHGGDVSVGHAVDDDDDNKWMIRLMLMR